MNNQQNKGDSVAGVGLPLNAVRTCDEVAHAILNLPSDPAQASFDFRNIRIAYLQGHKDARHAAFELMLRAAAQLGAVSVPSETAAGAQKQDHPSEIAELEQEASLMRARNERLQQERDALLEACRELMQYAGIIEERCDCVATDKARAAIAKAEGRA